MANFTLSNNLLTWAMAVVGAGGKALGTFEVVLPLGQARDAAMGALRFARGAGADINATIRRELDTNEDSVSSAKKLETVPSVRSFRAVCLSRRSSANTEFRLM